jgi:hypothetical protein
MSGPIGETFFGRRIPFLDLLGARAEAREKGRAVISLPMQRTATWWRRRSGRSA